MPSQLAQPVPSSTTCSVWFKVYGGAPETEAPGCERPLTKALQVIAGSGVAWAMRCGPGPGMANQMSLMTFDESRHAVFAKSIAAARLPAPDALGFVTTIGTSMLKMYWVALPQLTSA